MTNVIQFPKVTIKKRTEVFNFLPLHYSVNIKRFPRIMFTGYKHIVMAIDYEQFHPFMANLHRDKRFLLNDEQDNEDNLSRGGFPWRM